MDLDDLWVEWWSGKSNEEGEPNELSRLTVDEARAHPFEQALPVRAPDGHRRQRNISGFRFSLKAGRHLFHESLRERQDLIRLEFDRSVLTMSTQPMVLACRTAGKTHRLIPDIFTRRCDGTARIVNSKSASTLESHKTQRVLRLYEAACAQLGFDHEVMTEPDAVWWSNVSWLAAYGRQVTDPDGIAKRMLVACAEHPHYVRDLLALGDDWFARPVLFHLLWNHRLTCNLDTPLTGSTLVASAAQLAEVR